MNRHTGGFYGVNEALFSSALACIVFSTSGAQPLTIVGVTGLISLFNYTIFDIIQRHDVALYPQFMTWVAIWAAIFHWLFAICNLCDYMRYVTDFSSQSFGAYVGIIYCIKGVELLIAEFESDGPTDGFMSTIIAIMFFFTVYVLEMVGRGLWFRPWMRGFLGDYAYPNQSSVAAQARQFPLKKPGGFHWDFFLLGCTSFIAGIIDIPLPNGLVPQAPVHTDSLTNYKSVLKIIKKEDGGEIRQQEIVAESVAEQRVSHFLMGLAIIATMTGPILIVLNLIPRALFGGVFFVVGWGGLEGNGIMAKIIYLIREPRFIQPDEPLLQIPRKRVAFYLFWQIFGFPVLIIALIPLRWKVLPMIFTAKELRIMDAPTADNEVVLASMGGKPRMPKGKEDEDGETDSPGGRHSADAQQNKWSAAERGVPREALRERAGGWSEA
ncbi:MAG: hypothetical protein ALECFALPRED_002237 [Alectoria fallacina]|uniref:Bicarbonate transporter-like transmembrane domain-containing protein n=1 Tax=Alectoria fallacina TaxID=1903189 RepID=A0A8H3FIY9_9LECA|nr:MAG: hypothetical protein ALECFALPRED_002237 [Alectoria fallacina]